MQPIIIIGSGMAGYTLAREYRKLNSEHDVILISADSAENYAKPTLSNAFAAKKQADQIALADVEKMRTQLKIQILNHSQVKSIDATQHQIVIENAQGQQTLNYAQLVMAVGANPIQLPIEGNGAADIVMVNSLNDYRRFRDVLDSKQQKRILIIGAGLIGCEFANDLVNLDYQISLVDLAPQPLGRLLPQKVAQLFQQGLTEKGIQFHLATSVREIELNDDQDYVVTLANGDQFVVDVVLSAVGLAANLDLAKACDLQTHRGITVDTHLQTSQPDIYAIGDCAEVAGHFLPYVMPIMQQARALAKTLNGDVTPVHYPAMPVAVKTPAAPLTILPPPIDVDVEWQDEHFEDGVLSKAFDGSGQLRGFILLGASAAKQRLALAKQVPDLIPIQAE